MGPSNDTVLWEQFRQGDPSALETLYSTWHKDLLWFGVQYCGDHELVKDEINQQFLQLWDKRAALPEIGNTKNYLITSLRNRLVNALKKAGHIISSPEIEIASPSWEQELIGLEDREQLLNSIKKAIQALAPRQQEIVLLRYYQAMSADEIAQKTGLTTRTVYNTLNTALQHLREALEEDNMDPGHSAHIHRLLFLLILVP